MPVKSIINLFLTFSSHCQGYFLLILSIFINSNLIIKAFKVMNGCNLHRACDWHCKPTLSTPCFSSLPLFNLLSAILFIMVRPNWQQTGSSLSVDISQWDMPLACSFVEAQFNHPSRPNWSVQQAVPHPPTKTYCTDPISHS